MGRFGQVENVEPTMRGQVFEAGLYLVELAGCKGVDGQQGDVFFIIEANIVESDNDKVKVGAQHSQVINTTNKKAKNAPWSDIKAFICAALDIPLTDKDQTKKIGEAMAEYICGPDQPLKGLVMKLQCTVRPPAPPEKPLPFTYHRWECVKKEDAKVLRDHLMSTCAASAA